MKDYSAEISARLEEARSCESLGIERTLERIGRARLLCVFGIGVISYPIVAALRRFAGQKIDLLCDNDPAKFEYQSAVVDPDLAPDYFSFPATVQK